MAKVLRPFYDAPSRQVVHPGDYVFPTPGRLEELIANGLVEGLSEEKAQPAPENKMAPVALNKATPAPAPVRTPAPTFGKARRR